MNTCYCGKDVSTEPVPSRYWCPECPSFTCNECGGENGYKITCKCWTPIENLNLADKKALFALMDLSLGKVENE